MAAYLAADLDAERTRIELIERKLRGFVIQFLLRRGIAGDRFGAGQQVVSENEASQNPSNEILSGQRHGRIMQNRQIGAAGVQRAIANSPSGEIIEAIEA